MMEIKEAEKLSSSQHRKCIKCETRIFCLCHLVACLYWHKPIKCLFLCLSKYLRYSLYLLGRQTKRKRERAKECKTVTHFYPMCTLDNDCFHFCLLKRTHLHRARSHTTQTLAQCSNGPMNEQTNAKSFT